MSTEVATPTTARAARQAAKPIFVAPTVDVYENADEIKLVADVPGATTDSLTIDLDRGELRIEAKRPGARFDGYRRVFTVPDGIDASAVKAELENGVLTVHLVKSKAVRTRRVPINGT